MFFGLNDVAFLAAVGRPPAVSDSDAEAYLQAVETADGNFLEAAVRTAVNDFVVGCKADGIWNAIKASCILAGARTLTGALVPLVGTVPTNNNFVSGDYNRKTGLVGDGSTKYLDTNRNNNADPQNNQSMCAWISTFGAGGNEAVIGAGTGSTTGASHILTQKSAGPDQFILRSRGGSTVFTTVVTPFVAGFHGINRATSVSSNYRLGGASGTISSTSQSSSTGQINVFARDLAAPAYTNARLAFYSIGESLDLALLDARVTALINAFDAAI